MISSDDPRSYRNHSNAHPGQANKPLDSDANTWIKSRIRVERKGLCTHVIPEVYVARGDLAADPATAVPQSANGFEWIPLHDERSGKPLQSVVLTSLPGGGWLLKRALRVWQSLLSARALVPTVVGAEPFAQAE